MSAPWSRPLARLAEQFPSLDVDVVSAPQAGVLRMLHAREVDLALIFERVGSDEREAFQEFGSEMLVAVVASAHPIARERQGRVRHEELLNHRQIAVASRAAEGSGGGADPRVLLGRKLWRTDSHLATLGLVQAGLGWAYLPQRLVEPLLASGALLKIEFENISNQIRLWVDVVWLKDRPLGLGAQRFIELMRESRTAGEG